MTFEAYWNRSTPMTFGPEKWTYARKREFRYTLQSYMLSTFKFARFQGKKVLEIGCGSGIDTIEMALDGARVEATDFTNNAVVNTQSLVDEVGLNGRVNVTKVDAVQLPFDLNTFDAVYSFGVIHHIPDVHKVLLEIARVLKPGGLFLGMVYNKESLLYQYSILHLHENEGLSEEQLISKYSERNVGCPHTHAYTTQELHHLFIQYFREVRTEICYNVIDLPEQRKVKLELPDGHPLGWHLVFEATK